MYYIDKKMNKEIKADNFAMQICKHDKHSGINGEKFNISMAILEK
jgi:hypothetical protein